MRSPDVPKVVADLLAEIAAMDGLKLQGKTQTSVYRGSKPFLHFHWNEDGVVADVRYTDHFERFAVDTKTQQRRLVTDVKKFLAQ